MSLYISAIADDVNIRHKGRALHLVSADIADMEREWRVRLSEALDKSGKSKREVSLAAGCGPGYLHDVLHPDQPKDPTIERLLRICQELNVSLTWIAYGVEMNEADERLLRAFASLTQKQRDALLDLADPEGDDRQ